MFCGHSETELTQLGKAQAAALGARLREVQFAAAYTSDFSRAMETAAFILEGRNVKTRPDPDLRELHYGEWEMRREREIAKLFPDEWRLMRAEDEAWRPPGGETIAEVRERTGAALDRIVRKHRGKDVLIVTHGTAINCMLSGVLGMALSHTFRFDVANCGISRLEVRRERMVVTLLNDTTHLAGLAAPAAGAAAAAG